MDIDYRKIGRRFRAAREQQHMTQAQIAELLGIAENSYSNMERGQQKLSLRRVIELCVILRVKPGTILNDCCIELINQDEIVLSENPERLALIQLLNNCSDESIHLLNLIAHTIYEDQIQ